MSASRHLVSGCVEPFTSILRSAPHRDIGRVPLLRLLESYLRMTIACRKTSTDAAQQQTVQQASNTYFNEWALRSVFSTSWHDVALTPVATSSSPLPSGGEVGAVSDDLTKACSSSRWAEGSQQSQLSSKGSGLSWRVLHPSFFMSSSRGRVMASDGSRRSRPSVPSSSTMVINGVATLRLQEMLQAMSLHAESQHLGGAARQAEVAHVPLVIPFSTLWDIRRAAFGNTSDSTEEGRRAVPRHAETQLFLSLLSLVQQVLITQSQLQRQKGLGVAAPVAVFTSQGGSTVGVSLEVLPPSVEFDAFLRCASSGVTSDQWCTDGTLRAARLLQVLAPTYGADGEMVLSRQGPREVVEQQYGVRVAKDSGLADLFGPSKTDAHRAIVKGCGALAKRLEVREENMKLCAKTMR